MFKRAVVFVAISTVALVFGVSSIAWAGNDQEGRSGPTDSVDGTRGVVQGESFYAPSGACIIYAFLVSTDTRQVEAGVLRCASNAAIDGTCNDDHTFVERYNGDNTGTQYFCTQGSNFDNGDLIGSDIERISTTSTHIQGDTLGASLAQSGFGLTDPTYATAWGEVTGGSACPTSSSANAHFYGWERMWHVSWTYNTSAPQHHYSTGIPAAPCWTVSSPQDPTNGSFDVY